MDWRWLAVSLALLGGCTKSNPAKSCDDGTCSDPAYPICDVTGAIAGEAGSCVSAACTADKFVECRGDVEVRCNPEGSNYNLVTCERGCDAAADGCRLCDPGETTCTNGKVATCDASGAVVSAQACPLGCFEDEPRCREIDPSNGLAMYLDMVANAPDLDLENATIYAATGRIDDFANSVSIDDVPTFVIDAPPNGIRVRVFVVNSFKATRVVVGDLQSGVISPPGPTAFALVAKRDIEIRGALSSLGTSQNISACQAGHGVMSSSCEYSSTGGGGGAFATNGAKGGNITSVGYLGGAGGIANGNERLVPLRGGCSGGTMTFSGTLQDYCGGGGGGGAMQLVSRTHVFIDGLVSVAGGPGAACEYEIDQGVYSYWATGGGSGGGLLIEAPKVTLDVNARLDALGGDGGYACATQDPHCTAKGIAARPGVAATAGADAAMCIGDGTPLVTGGGGAGMGRIRINTADGTYTKASSAVEDGVVSAGTIETR
jgi:hypothetical protein